MTAPTGGPRAAADAAEMQRRYRRRIALFLVAVLGALALMGAAQWTIEAMRRVAVVESERDRWQRPTDVIDALHLAEGSSVVDLGSGVGYFALKLSERVGRRGRVLAVDVRRFPLLFLRTRAFLGGRRNLGTIRGDPDDPGLPADGVDAVLVANTYHELTDPGTILDRLFEALRPGGRLVVVDPGPDAIPAGPPEGGDHHVTAASAEARLRRAGFEILSRQDAFVERAGHEPWWLIVARKPGPGDPLSYHEGTLSNEETE